MKTISLNNSNEPKQPINIKIKIRNLKITILLSLLFMISYKAQTLPLNTALNDISANAYVKDINNELDPYICL